MSCIYPGCERKECSQGLCLPHAREARRQGLRERGQAGPIGAAELAQLVQGCEALAVLAAEKRAREAGL